MLSQDCNGGSAISSSPHAAGGKPPHAGGTSGCKVDTSKYTGSVMATSSPPDYYTSNIQPIECSSPADKSGYAVASEVLDVPNFAVSFTGGACAAGYEGTPKADPCSASGPYTLSGCTPSEFYCLGGAGGPCYQANTECFFDDGDPPGCPNMGNWIAANDYSNTYESFQTFCSSWGANSGAFNGGVGSCAYEKGPFGAECADNAGIGTWEECKKAAASLGIPLGYSEYPSGSYYWTPLGCWFWDGAIQGGPNELGFSDTPGNGDTRYNPICVCGHAGTPCPT